MWFLRWSLFIAVMSAQSGFEKRCDPGSRMAALVSLARTRDCYRVYLACSTGGRWGPKICRGARLFSIAQGACVLNCVSSPQSARRYERKDEPSGRIDRPSERIDQPPEREDQPLERIDQPQDHTDQPPERIDQPLDNKDQPPERIDQPSDNKDQPPERIDQPSDNKNQPPERIDQPSDNKDQPPERIDQPSDNKDQPPERIDQPSDNKDQPPERIDQPSDNKDQPPERIDQPSDNKDQPPERIDQPSDHKDQPPERIDQPLDHKDQPPERIDQPSDHKDQPPERIDQPSDHKDQPPERIDQPLDHKDQPPERIDKPLERRSEFFERRDKPSDTTFHRAWPDSQRRHGLLSPQDSADERVINFYLAPYPDVTNLCADVYTVLVSNPSTQQVSGTIRIAAAGTQVMSDNNDFTLEGLTKERSTFEFSVDVRSKRRGSRSTASTESSNCVEPPDACALRSSRISSSFTGSLRRNLSSIAIFNTHGARDASGSHQTVPVPGRSEGFYANSTEVETPLNALLWITTSDSTQVAISLMPVASVCVEYVVQVAYPFISGPSSDLCDLSGNASFRQSVIYLMAAENNTAVWFTFPVHAPGGESRVGSDDVTAPIRMSTHGFDLFVRRSRSSVTLTAYEGVTVEAAYDLTGTVIRSDRPLAVFTGTREIPDDRQTPGRVVTQQQQLPVAAAGKTFVSLPLDVTSARNIIRVTSVTGGETKVQVIANHNMGPPKLGSRVYILRALGHTTDIDLERLGRGPGVFMVKSDKAVLVKQTTATEAMGECSTNLLSAHAWSKMCSWALPSSLQSANNLHLTLVLVMRTHATGSFRLDGREFTGNWKPVLSSRDESGSEFSVGRIAVDAGKHTAETAGRRSSFAAYLHGTTEGHVICTSLCALTGQTNLRTVWSQQTKVEDFPVWESPEETEDQNRTSDSLGCNSEKSSSPSQPTSASITGDKLYKSTPNSLSEPPTTQTTDMTSSCDAIKARLLVPPKSTSATRRKLTSATDGRPSSVTMGTAGMAVCVCVLAAPLLNDLVSLYRRFFLDN